MVWGGKVGTWQSERNLQIQIFRSVRVRTDATDMDVRNVASVWLFLPRDRHVLVAYYPCGLLARTFKTKNLI
jgi:hypothetical protein